MPIKHQPTISLETPECQGDIVQVDDLHFAYPDGHIALKGVSFGLCEGEKVALVGPNGAGKSTLMLHLNGILHGNGSIRISGMNITNKNLPIIRGIVGMVFQNPDDQLFSPTVFDDVAFGPLNMGFPENEIKKRVEEALTIVEMTGFGDRLSHHLSAGQKKRVAIASVLSMDPKILILDEPSSGLDPRARRSLINFLLDIPMTMLVSTHDLRMVQDVFPRMIIMDGGELVVDGETNLLLQDEALLIKHGLEKP